MTASQIIKHLKSKKNKDLDIYRQIDQSPTQTKQFISTGLKKLDLIMTNKVEGGFPVGKLTTITGEEGSGKTLIALMAAKDAIKRDGIVIWIDTENSLNPDFAYSYGIPKDRLVYIQLNTVQAMFETMDQLTKQIRQKNSQKLILIVVDSIAGLSTRPQVQGRVGDSNYGQAAKMLSQGLRKHIISFGKMRVCMIFTNQLRYKMNSGLFEDPLSAMYGGKAIPYYSSIMMKLRKAAKIKKDEQVIGNQVSVTIQKNRMAPRFRKTKFECIYDQGISQIGEVLEDLKDMGMVIASGRWYQWAEGPLCSDEKFQKKDFPQMFKKKEVNQFIWECLAKKYILDVNRVIDADLISGQSEIVDIEQKDDRKTK